MAENYQEHKHNGLDEERQSSDITQNVLKDKNRTIETNPVSETSSLASTLRKKSLSLFHRDPDSKVQKEAKRREKRESMSDRGAFRLEYSSSGLPIMVENQDWPPGTNSKTSSRAKQLQNGSLGDFYEGQGAIVAGGETAGNCGPDPDWIPGLSEEEKKKLKNDKSGRYVF